MSPQRRKLLRRVLWLTTCVFWVTIFILTHVPIDHLPKADVGDKTAHFIAYFALASLLYTSTWITNPRHKLTGAMVLMVGLVYGAIDELLQPYVNRSADLEDWLYDVAGTTTAVILLVTLRVTLKAARALYLSARRSRPSAPSASSASLAQST